ncbi:IscS subfamily cysteine desulfurase [Bacillus gobiensis]|uniref:IscS subfamily cysteine desulfurase n=1 Tax=Bacillus gobiensis TaxID=1441095 RepID=UPI003D1B3A78
MIYLDYAATTPMCEPALTALQKLSSDIYANSRSLHDGGEMANRILDYSREQLAHSIGGQANGLYFTSGGSESNWLAIYSLLLGLPKGKRHFVTTTVEHPSIISTAEYVKQIGFEVSFVAPDKNGLITSEALLNKLRPDTGLVSIQHANSETGVIQPLAELSCELKERGILLHTDAVQTFGKLPINILQLGVDAISFASHKIYGPKGIGAVYIRPDVFWKPVFPHTSHEKGFRPGTVNVPGVGAFAAAAEWIIKRQDQQSQKYEHLRKRLVCDAKDQKLSLQPALSNSTAKILPHIFGCFFPPYEGQYVMLESNRKGICLSTGTACSAEKQEPSQALTSLGYSKEKARQFIRISFGYETTDADIASLLQVLKQLQKNKKGAAAIARRS